MDRRAAQRRDWHEHRRPRQGHDQAAALPLELRVRCDEEDRQEAHGAVGLGRDQLDHDQQRDVSGRDHRVELEVGPPLGQHEVAERPGQADGRYHNRQAAVEGRAGGHQRDEGGDRQEQPKRRELEDGLGRLDRRPPKGQHHVRLALAASVMRIT